MIIRRRYNRNFTVLSNTVFDDDRLSLDALGVLCYLRSRPEDWSVHLQQLGSRFKVGREKMQRITRELIDAGWIQREQSRELGGTFASVEYVVYDEPELGAPQSENPTAVATSEYLPQSGLPPTVNPTAAYKEETLNTERHKNPLTPKGAASAGRLNSKEWERDAGYQRFLEAYRPSLAWRKHLAYRNWRKLSDDDKAAAIANIAAYRAYCAKEQRKMSDPTAYLDGTFGNFITSTRARAPESPALSALRSARPGEGVLVEFGTPEWLAWQAVADAASYPLHAVRYPARPLAGRPVALTGAHLPSRLPPGEPPLDRQRQAAGERDEDGADASQNLMDERPGSFPRGGPGGCFGGSTHP